MSALVGMGVSLVVFFCGCAAIAFLRRAECGNETRPFLGSTKQTFVITGCLARDAGPLIDIKKRLGIYDPAWMTTIK